MLYIAQGYIFITVFEFIVFKDNEKNTDFLILKSIVISYVLKVVYDKILYMKSIELDKWLYVIILFVVSALLAYLLALILKTAWFNKFLSIIGIKRTINENIWFDAVRDGCFLRIYSKDGSKSYSGTCKYRESYDREPIVVLTEYRILDANSEIIIDYSEDSNRSIMLNLKNFERIDITQSQPKPKKKRFGLKK